MKYLNNIRSPEDLRSYSKEDLEFICNELREYIIETINKIGGHLAPILLIVSMIYSLNSLQINSRSSFE
jgi:1-deoxy-D-xylulose-5-phosphate synthase